MGSGILLSGVEKGRLLDTGCGSWESAGLGNRSGAEGKEYQSGRKEAADRMKKERKRHGAQGSGWRRLDNTGKLFAAVTGEDLSNVFRISVVLKREVDPELLQKALSRNLLDYENFRVKLRKGFFWYYFETNNREPAVEVEDANPCRYINPHAGHRFPFRVSYRANRLNFEVFHGLTDGLGALNFAAGLAERYLELAESRVFDMERAAHGGKTEIGEANREPEQQNQKGADSYLANYKKGPHQRYEKRCSLQLPGRFLPFGFQSVMQGNIQISKLKEVCRSAGASITRYLAAALIWTIIQEYTDGKELKRPVALNLPVNLRNMFESETMANFFAVVNISWPAGRAPARFEEVLEEVSRQMKEQIVREKLEETISYNVSNEKKWYVRMIPLCIKHLALNVIFLKSMRAHTLTFSNVGQAVVSPIWKDAVESFELLIGASAKQRMKCGAIAYGENLCVTFTSALQDTRLPDAFFGFLEQQGVAVRRDSNGVVDREHDRGRFPRAEKDPGKWRRAVRILNLALLVTAALCGLLNLATYRMIPVKWSFLAMGGIAYVAMTLRYSVMRLASAAGTIVRQSLGIQVLLVLADVLNGGLGWSVDYAIPCMILFDVVAVVLLMAVNRTNWQNCFMYQIALTVFSFIPLILWAIGWIRRPFWSILTVTVSVGALGITLLLGEKSTWRELKRRFHI